MKQKSKRSAIILDDSDEDVEEGPKKRSRIQSDTFEEIKEDIAEIASVVREIKELDKTNSVPLALKQLIIDAFKCKMCLQAPMAAPPIFSRCCKTLLGCEMCVNSWYTGDDALTKKCPVCRAEQGYSDTMVLRGLDEFLVGVAKVLLPDSIDHVSDHE